jgi:tripartite ATP-independent transporter DctP family solute receptor
MNTITRRRFGSGIAAALAAPAIARAAEFTYKLGTNNPISHPLTIWLQRAIDAIAKDSNGRMVIQLFPDSQLGGDSEMFSQVRNGIIQFFPVSALLVQGVVPTAGISGIAFAFSSYKQVWPAMDGEFGAYVRKQLQLAGIFPLEKIWDTGFREITSAARPIHGPADLKGFKLRIPVQPLAVSLFQSLGSAPTTLNINEAYSALQTHLVDGQDNPLVVVNTFKFYEVQKYCALTNHMWDGIWVCANPAAWRRLPADLQAIVMKDMNSAADGQRTDIQHMNETMQPELEKHGMVFNTVDPEPFRVALRESGYYARWHKEFGDEGWKLLEKYVGTLG